mmetsp:Transcript_46788/g.123672  ORF Transcript_46788/g.123672 Transcript_46788/m.123672 type:complete len:307 (+) Transcript_46788:429-1349(+)
MGWCEPDQGRCRAPRPPGAALGRRTPVPVASPGVWRQRRRPPAPCNPGCPGSPGRNPGTWSAPWTADGTASQRREKRQRMALMVDFSRYASRKSKSRPNSSAPPPVEHLRHRAPVPAEMPESSPARGRPGGSRPEPPPRGARPPGIGCGPLLRAEPPQPLISSVSPAPCFAPCTTSQRNFFGWRRCCQGSAATVPSEASPPHWSVPWPLASPQRLVVPAEERRRRREGTLSRWASPPAPAASARSGATLPPVVELASPPPCPEAFLPPERLCSRWAGQSRWTEASPPPQTSAALPGNASAEIPPPS